MSNQIMSSQKIITVGSKVKLKINGKEMIYTLVYPLEANIKFGKISIYSPIGRGILGKSEKDLIKIKLPEEKNINCQILEVN